MKISFSIFLLLISISAFGLTAITDIQMESTPEKSDVQQAINLLQKSISSGTNVNTSDLKKAKEYLKNKNIDQKFKAAIYVKENFSGSQYLNLVSFKGYIDSTKSICYAGKIKTAFSVLNLLKDNFWISDENTLDGIEIKGRNIYVNVFDIFTFNDVGAYNNEKDNFIRINKISKCKK